MTAHPEASRLKRPFERTETNDLTTVEPFDLFGDKYTRRVYETVVEQPRCGKDVAEATGVSRPTAYRHLNALRDAGSVWTEMSIRGDEYY